MKLFWNRKYTTIAVYAVLVLVAALLVVFFFLNNSDFSTYISQFFKALAPILYGLVIAYLINPIVRLFDTKVFGFLAKKPGRFRLRRCLSIVAAMIIFLAFIALISWALIPQLISSIVDFQWKFNDYADTIREWLVNTAATSRYLGKVLYSVVDYVNGLLQKVERLMDYVIPVFSVVASAIVNIVKNLIIGMIFAVLVLYNKEFFSAKWRKILRAILSEKKYEKFTLAVRKADDSFGGYIKGTLVDALLVGVVTFFLMMIIGIPYYPLIAIVLALTNMIPVFGPYIGSIPSGFLILLAEPKKVLPFAIMVVVVQIIDGNLVAPKLIGSNIGLRPEWVITAITIMSGFFGVAGMLLGVPLFAVVYTIISDNVRNKLKGRGLPYEDADYCPEKSRGFLLERSDKKLLQSVIKNEKSDLS